MKLVVALHKFFGLLPGQKLADFKAELTALTEKDRTELAEMLTPEMGETVEP